MVSIKNRVLYDINDIKKCNLNKTTHLRNMIFSSGFSYIFGGFLNLNMKRLAEKKNH